MTTCSSLGDEASFERSCVKSLSSFLNTRGDYEKHIDGKIILKLIYTFASNVAQLYASPR